MDEIITFSEALVGVSGLLIVLLVMRCTFENNTDDIGDLDDDDETEETREQD